MHKKLFAGVLGLSLMAPAFAFAQLGPANTSARPAATAELRANATTTRPNLDATTTRLGPDATTEERMRRAKMLAEQEITRRLNTLNATTERIEKVRRLNDSFKTELRTDLNAETNKLNALRARIQAGEDPETLRADVQSITRSHRTFALVVPQAHIAAAAERIVTITAMMGEVGLKLRARIGAAGEAGHDITALQTALASLSAHIDSANFHARAAVEGTATLTPDEGDTAVLQANQAALKAAREELRLAHQDVVEGRADIRIIIDGLKAFRPA
ncbi:MAG: hypothetical protein U1C66_00370, partial [Patescibacteria group bacterium]|nr:hypothetical protein [Patescibacteria group bacterium]